MRRFTKIVLYCFSVFFMLAVVGAGGAVYAFWYYGQDLPDYRQLAQYRPKIATRVHAGDGQVITEFATEKRSFVPIEAIPKRVIQAFIAAEDQRFYDHRGVDPISLGRAVAANVLSLGSGKRMVGGSTITQQVAKNFLVGSERRMERKIREAIIAIRMEEAFSKDQILELYLNEIYLGVGTYGVAAASLGYFNKSLDELTVAEAAYLGALPKAPANYDPRRYSEAAKERRDWVIGRMLEEGYITEAEAIAAVAEPLVMVDPDVTRHVVAAYFVEEVRREIVSLFGEDALYEGGLSVRTTIDPKLQAIADAALRHGLVAYDQRHGWRGPVARLPAGADWEKWLAETSVPLGARNWSLGVVLKLNKTQATIGLAGSATIGSAGSATGTIPLAEMVWAREWLSDDAVGPDVTEPKDVLAIGDAVLVEAVSSSVAGGDVKPVDYPPGTYALRQIPAVNGAIVALDPHTGRVLAMSGGYDFTLSEFNRATQAWRQPGSAFKPFVYLAALDNGYTPATMILDAPFVIDQGPDKGKWKPTNYSDTFYGPSPMRLGIEKSRNLMTVRLAKAVGMGPVIENARKFGIVEDMPRELAMSLGAGETTLLRLSTAYAMLANGGRQIAPMLIDRVQDRTGKTIFRHEQRPCDACRVERWENQPVPVMPDTREQIADPVSAYQIVSMLQGVVQRGTGYQISSIGKPLAGKTGTTNESQDAWFIGFSPDLLAGTYIGFDFPKSLGEHETGASAAIPVFKEFMELALAGRPAVPFRMPAGIRMMRMNGETGLPAKAGDDPRHIVLEAFRRGTEPSPNSAMLLIDGSDNGSGTETVGGSNGIPGQPRTPEKRTTDTGMY